MRLPHRRPHGRIAAAALAATLCLAGTGTAAASAATPAGATPGATPATVIVDQADAGVRFDPSMQGLSFEDLYLSLPQLASGNLARYLRTLGPGIMRFGGNTADQTFWTSTGEPQPSWAQATITPADLDRLAQLSRESGWKVELGVNLKEYDPARAADEIAHAKAALGRDLYAVDIGNEPNYYYSSTSTFWTAFQTYVAAISAAAPGVKFTGPGDGEPSSSSLAFRQGFVSNQLALPTPDVIAENQHFYPTSDCSGPGPTIAQLLSTTTRDDEQTVADALVTQASTMHLPAVIGETNSVVCEGEPGVSNVFASTLWSLDYQLLLASQGIQHAYFHGSVLQCGSPKPDYMYYTPLCAVTATDAAGNLQTAQPEYYGLLAFRQLGGGQFLGVENADTSDVRAYAIRQGGLLRVVLINVDDPASSGPADVTVDLGKRYHHGARSNLVTSSPDGLSAQTGISLGGGTMRANGSFAGQRLTPLKVHGDSVTVSVPAGSATVLTLE